jgi:hypothetical protein
MDKITLPYTNEDFLFTSNLWSLVKPDVEGTSTSYTYHHQIRSSYLDRIKVPSYEYTAWEVLRSDAAHASALVNTIVLGNGDIASYSWDRKILKTCSFSHFEKRYKSKTIGEELLHHDRNEWTLGPSRYAERYIMKAGLRKMLNRIVSFTNFKENWDSYGAKPFQPATIARALFLFTNIAEGIERLGKSVPLPFISPCSDGGIQFEWETSNKELTIIIPPDESLPLEYLLVYSEVPHEEQELEGTFDTVEKAVEAINCLLSLNCVYALE